MYPDKIVTLIETNRLSEAIDALLNFLNKNPYDISAWCDIGYCFLNVGNYFEAIRYLKAALMLSKDKEEKKARPVIYLNLAQAYKYNKDYEKSKNSLDEYFKLVKKNDINYKQAQSLDEELKRKFQFTNI